MFGDPPPLLTEWPPTGDPELEVFDAVERPVPVVWCCTGIGIGMEEEAGGNPCDVAGGVNKWPAFPLGLPFPLVWYGCPCGEKPV